MDKQNSVTIQTLREQLVSELKKNNYTRGTIQLYTEYVNQILRYMAANNVNAYLFCYCSMNVCNKINSGRDKN